jgi:cytidine deaminase
MTREELILTAREVAKNAHSPYSRFNVGAAILWDDGSLTVGCNVENASYGLTCCAERVAAFSGKALGYKKIAKVAVTCSPKGSALPDDTPKPYRMCCGACRQVLAEFGDDNVPVYVDKQTESRMMDDTSFDTTIGNLLPDAFRL